VVGGFVVPAQSAAEYTGRVVFTPTGQIRTVSTTSRGVGFYTTGGQWVLAWCGDSVEDRDYALSMLLVELAVNGRRRGVQQGPVSTPIETNPSSSPLAAGETATGAGTTENTRHRGLSSRPGRDDDPFP
jgi:hypothetical protein